VQQEPVITAAFNRKKKSIAQLEDDYEIEQDVNRNGM